VDALFGYATGLHRQGLKDRTEAGLREALAIQQRIGREGRINAGELLNALGMVVFERAAYPEAIQLLEQAVANHERAGREAASW